MKKLLITGGALLAAKIVWDKWIVRTEGSDGGFIDVKPGIGLDDAAFVGVMLAGLFAARKFGGG